MIASYPDISIVIPVYLGEKFLEELVERLEKTLEKIDKSYEILMVNDASPDKSEAIIQRLCKAKKQVKGIIFSRNFGQHYAIHAGLEHSRGHWVVVMDCDLQDKPEEIEHLFKKAAEGFDIVLAQRFERKDLAFKRLSSKIFYKIFGYLTDTEQDSSIANFGIYHRKVIDAILSMKDHIRYFPAMVQWVGFSKTKIQVQHQQRVGKSSYTLSKLLNLAFDNIIAFSDKPLRIVTKFGIMVSAIAGLMGCYYLYLYLMGEIVVLGFVSLIISIWLLSGIIIFTLGVLGIYLGKTFERVKNRPLYLIQTKINLEE